MSDSTTAWIRRIVAAIALVVAFSLGTCVGTPDATPPTAEQGEVWTCSMHPQIRQGEPGQCPLCGMDLIPANSAGTEATGQVTLSERARTLAKVRTTVVRRKTDAASEIRLLGRIEPAESTRRNVTTWIGGRIDRLHVNTTGEQVRRGQTIATLYSPEVYAAHQDLITAKGQVARLGQASPAAKQAAEAALAAARERLRLLGVPERELEAMAQADTPARTVAIRSPFAGTVIERVATEGAYVDTGATLYRVADLGTLWVQLDAYETDLPRLAVGQTVTLTIDALPGEEFAGTVDFIDPTVDPQRRTARVRVVVDNSSGRLRPGMFADATVAVASDDQAPLVIPASAPLFTGRRSVVYVEVEGPRGPAYEPRTVRLGPVLGDQYPVVSGLSEGERVVSRGAFALDADLQIKGGASMMTLGDDRSPEGPAPLPLTDGQRRALAPVLEHYLHVQQSLAEDDLSAATAAAGSLASAIATAELPESAATAWASVSQELRSHAVHVAHATDLETARGGFEPLSAAVESLLARFGNPLEEPVHVAFCPMANDDGGARWVQAGDTVDNAYFGDAMRTCGDFTATVAPGTYLDAAPATPMPAMEHVH